MLCLTKNEVLLAVESSCDNSCICFLLANLSAIIKINMRSKRRFSFLKGKKMGTRIICKFTGKS